MNKGARQNWIFVARWVLALILLVALVFGVLPYQIGVQVERSLLDAHPLGQLKKANRGWFYSCYQLEVPIIGSVAPLLVDIRLRHGPHLRQGKFHLAAGRLSVARESLIRINDWQDLHSIALDLRIDLTGTAHLSPVLADQSDASSTHLAEAETGAMGYSFATGHLRGLVELPGLRVISPTQTLLLGRTRLDLDLIVREDWRWRGDLGLSVGRLGVARAGGGWTADDLSLRGRRVSVSEEALRENISLSIALDSFSRRGESLGPFRLLAEAKELDPRVWRELADLMRQTWDSQQQGQSSLLAVQQLWPVVQGQVLSLLSDSKVTLDALQLNFSNGQLYLGFDALGPQFVAYRQGGVPDWQVNGQLRISPELLQEWLTLWLADLGMASAQETAERMIGKFSRLGWLSYDQGDWITSFNRVQGEWWLNGHLVEAGELLPQH